MRKCFGGDALYEQARQQAQEEGFEHLDTLFRSMANADGKPT